MVKALTPFLAAFIHRESQKALTLSVTRTDDQSVSHTGEAVQEVQAFNGLTENDLFPPGMKILVAFDIAPMQFKKGFVVVIPV